MTIKAAVRRGRYGRCADMSKKSPSKPSGVGFRFLKLGMTH
jgi:hypothetical protein